MYTVCSNIFIGMLWWNPAKSATNDKKDHRIYVDGLTINFNAYQYL